jgi:hypothetical protein
MVRIIIFRDFVVRVKIFHTFLVRMLKKYGKHCSNPMFLKPCLAKYCQYLDEKNDLFLNVHATSQEGRPNVFFFFMVHD